MSYILDALRRAEHERRTQSASRLEQVAAVPPPVTRQARRLHWVLLAAFGVGAIVLTIWWAGRPEKRLPHLHPAEAAATAPTVTTSSEAVAAAAARAHRRRPTPTPTIITAPQRIVSLDDVVPPPAVPTPPPETAPGAARQDYKRSHVHAPGAAAASHASENPEVAPGAAAAATVPAAAVTASLPSPSVTAAVTPAQPAAAPQSLRQMPESYRASFPRFSVQVHVYDADPAKRWVMIDGHRYQQGQSLPSGPTIYEIVPQGIVFDWHGQRVLYALNR